MLVLCFRSAHNDLRRWYGYAATVLHCSMLLDLSFFTPFPLDIKVELTFYAIRMAASETKTGSDSEVLLVR